jgi:hypothetical protein
MLLNLRGFVKSSKRRLFVDGDECLGVTRVYGHRFGIRIVETKSLVEFYDTLLHELLHLFFFIFVSVRNKEISTHKQHRVINKAVPYILRLLARELK